VCNLGEWKRLVDDVRVQWRLLWRDRIDDRVRAEGIANQDYSLLFVDQGDVIIATRDFRPLSFRGILLQHMPSEVEAERVIPPIPSIGGWGKFIRDVVRKQKHLTERRRSAPLELDHDKKQQLKKGGRGWLHFRFRRK